MSRSIKTDIARPGGGYALLRVGQSQLVTSIAIQDRGSGDFLSESGKWGKQRIYFPVENAGEGFVRLGPQIVDHILVDTAVAIYQNENGLFANLVWPALRQSAGGRPNWTVGGKDEEPPRSSSKDAPRDAQRKAQIDRLIASIAASPVAPQLSAPVRASLSSPEVLPQRRARRVGIAALLALLAIILSYAVYTFWGRQNNIVAQRPAPMAGKLTIIGPETVTFSGYKGELFNWKNIEINISADGNGFNWITKAKPNWLEVSPQSGTLSDSNSTTLSIKPNSAASSVPIGTYEDQVAFANETSDTAVPVNVSLIIKDPDLDCDRLMGNRFEPERPAGAPYVINTFRATEDGSTALAIRACLASMHIDPGIARRRYIAQAGRAYAVGAEAKAVAGNDADAQAEMKQAIQLSMDGSDHGASAAMNSLGALWNGTYNAEVTAARQKKNSLASPFSFVAPNMQTALDYWLKGAGAGNATSMRNAGVLLLGDFVDPPPLFKDVPRALNLLNQAMQKGDTRAASILGAAYYYGTPAEVGKNPTFGLELLARACTESDANAKEFFTREVQIKHRLTAEQVPSGCSASAP
jgi:hypothetical protein